MKIPIFLATVIKRSFVNLAESQLDTSTQSIRGGETISPKAPTPTSSTLPYTNHTPRSASSESSQSRLQTPPILRVTHGFPATDSYPSANTIRTDPPSVHPHPSSRGSARPNARSSPSVATGTHQTASSPQLPTRIPVDKPRTLCFPKMETRAPRTPCKFSARLCKPCPETLPPPNEPFPQPSGRSAAALRHPAPIQLRHSHPSRALGMQSKKSGVSSNAKNQYRLAAPLAANRPERACSHHTTRSCMYHPHLAAVPTPPPPPPHPKPSTPLSAGPCCGRRA
ncbi:hypothetical protein MPH_09137 [Macrophomina phaseolina MS6]|uniref:Uncharacterized protein n=1 Tax=Macrophomina phaseolina (strain MS6) TaxID=1126212 RepID=K2QVF4_MACPH|nr:hypothetical protein MPH_09137 [Macrophomina phaseolina MS6]